MSWIEMVIAIVTSVMASSGFWAYFTKKSDRKDGILLLLLGLAHDRVVSVGKEYIKRGWLTYDEYDDFLKYLYNPYQALGGNGYAEMIRNEVERLPRYDAHRKVSLNMEES